MNSKPNPSEPEGLPDGSLTIVTLAVVFVIVSFASNETLTLNGNVLVQTVTFAVPAEVETNLPQIFWVKLAEVKDVNPFRKALGIVRKSPAQLVGAMPVNMAATDDKPTPNDGWLIAALVPDATKV